MKKYFLVFCASFLLTGCGWWHSEEEYQEILRTPISSVMPEITNPDERIRFIVEKGMSTRAIAAKLEKLQVVPAGWAVEWYVERNEMDGKLQAGDYILRASWSTPRIVEEMLTGRKSEISVTIPEGYRLTQIDNLFAEKGLTKSGEILAQKYLQTDFTLPKGVDLEGYLFPDTYYFVPEETTAQSIVQRLTDTMSSRITSQMRSDIAKSGYSLHEILTIASLIERESFSDNERPIIAGIIYNRLDAGMTLGIDATIQYAVSDGWPKSLTYEDLQIDNQYNTRKYAGLPPGPICSPSLSAIEAAIYPAQTDYYYYLHDSAGVAHYARTNAEHNQNRELYL